MAARQSESDGMTTNRDVEAMPPRWAEALLRMTLKRDDRDPVSGDVLEEYREAIVPARGRAAANRWYLRQVAGYMWRATWLWAVLFSGAFVVRQAFDFLVPTTDFYIRSTVTTYTAMTLLATTAFWSAWRSGWLLAGIVVTVVMTQVAALMSVVGVTALLAIWHDPGTLQAAANSGGIGEAYVLPFMAVVPAVIVGSAAASLGSAARFLVRVTAA
jgi:hypothetical protein